MGRTTLEMGIDSAVINFNAGSSRIIDVMKEYGIQDGYYTNVFCMKKDEERIEECNRKVKRVKHHVRGIELYEKGLQTKKKKRRELFMELACVTLKRFMF